MKKHPKTKKDVIDNLKEVLRDAGVTEIDEEALEEAIGGTKFKDCTACTPGGLF